MKGTIKINDVHFSSVSNEWETPQALFDSLNNEFGFTLDPCSTEKNHKCDKFYTQETNGLDKDWSKDTVFMNPPYGRAIGKWVKKAYDESQKGATVVCLIPSRTDTRWFHDYIYNNPNAEIRFLRGRLKFINRTLPSYREDGDFNVSPAPFPSMVVVFHGNK